MGLWFNLFLVQRERKRDRDERTQTDILLFGVPNPKALLVKKMNFFLKAIHFSHFIYYVRVCI